MVKGKVDLNEPRNLVIVSIILVAGIGDLNIVIGAFTIGGIGLAGIIGILLNIILPKTKQTT